MNVASIDIGSNTVLLLVAKVNPDDFSFMPLLNAYRVPRISKGISFNKLITQDKIWELLNVLKEYKTICSDFMVSKYIIKATNAMRIANNSAYIIDFIKNEIGMNIEVIPGEEEANLSYLGAKSSFVDFNEAFVLDIGGGSTEFIHGNRNGILFRKSFAKGAVNLTEEYISEYPANNLEFNRLAETIDKSFNEIKNFSGRNIPLIAVAGTPTTLSCIVQNINSYDENIVEKSVLTKLNLIKIIEEFRKKTPGEILNEYGKVVEGREDVILTGTKVLLSVIENLNLDSFYVSGRGLRYGSIVQFTKELRDKQAELP